MQELKLIDDKIKDLEQIILELKAISRNILNASEVRSKEVETKNIPIIYPDSKKDLYDQALKVVIEHRSASASLLQRRLGIGYNRAISYIKKMEEEGIVNCAQGTRPREVLKY